MKAFTLVEMLLVMVLLAVAAAFSLPNLSRSYTRIQTQNTANNLSYMMRYAQSRAVTQNKIIRLSFNDLFNKYQLLEPSSKLPSKEFQPIVGQWGNISVLPEHFTINSSKPSIDFFPNGEIEKTDILLCNGKECLIISTQQQRGQIEVLDAN